MYKDWGGKDSAYSWGNLWLSWRLRLICVKFCQRQPGALVSCAVLESYLIVHVCSRAVSVHRFCPAWSIVFPCRCRRRSLIWVCWIVLFALRKGCVRVSFVVCGTEGRLLSCVCSLKFITERTTLCMSICILLFQLILVSEAVWDSIGDPALQNLSIHSVVYACWCAYVELAVVGCV